MKLIRRISLVLFLLLNFISIHNSSAEDQVFRLSSEPGRARNFIFPPLISFFLPGFDQYLEKQYSYGFAYSGAALIGLGFSYAERNSGTTDVQYNHPPENEREKNERESVKYFNSYRKIGPKLFETAGAFSAYHSFRSAASSRPASFPFLKKADSPKDLLVAPVKFSFLGRTTTFIPLALGGLIAILDINQRTHKDRYTTVGDGLGLTGAFSYMAGTGEEALFRGWLMPMSHYWTSSAFWGNAISSIVFGAAHYSSSNKFPLFQALMGGYLGYVSQRNEYSLQESIFIHTWWDVIALGTLLLSKKHGKDVRVYRDLVNFNF